MNNQLRKNIKELKNLHKGKDLWVLGSGPSLNFIDSSFFENKILIGLNRVYKFVDCKFDYVLIKDLPYFEKIDKEMFKNSNFKLVMSKMQYGDFKKKPNIYSEEHYIFDHPEKINEEPDLSAIRKDSDKLVVGHSTITSAIHFAAYLGAKNIILVGHDCGMIDNESNVTGYNKGTLEVWNKTYAKYGWVADPSGPAPSMKAVTMDLVSKFERQTCAVSKKITKEYGCNIHSLNPFINLNLEGHTYTPSNPELEKQNRIEKNEQS